VITELKFGRNHLLWIECRVSDREAATRL
jgi:hypothetical protein